MQTEFTGVEPIHCSCCGAPELQFYFRTDRSADGPPLGNEGQAAKALTRAARLYLAILRQKADHEVTQPALRFEGYDEETD
jgi:hypothetical protein